MSPFSAEAEQDAEEGLPENDDDDLFRFLPFKNSDRPLSKDTLLFLLSDPDGSDVGDGGFRTTTCKFQCSWLPTRGAYIATYRCGI